MHNALKYGAPSTEQLRFFKNFVVSYDARMRNPRWVLEHITTKQIRGEGSRCTSPDSSPACNMILCQKGSQKILGGSLKPPTGKIDLRSERVEGGNWLVLFAGRMLSSMRTNAWMCASGAAWPTSGTLAMTGATWWGRCSHQRSYLQRLPLHEVAKAAEYRIPLSDEQLRAWCGSEAFRVNQPLCMWCFL